MNIGFVNKSIDKINIFRIISDRILSTKLSFISNFGYLLVFIFVLLGNSPFIGILIPSSIMLFFGGFVAKLGFMNLWVLLVLAICVGVGGDMISYHFGSKIGGSFLKQDTRYFFIKKKHLEKTYNLVHNHTGKSLIFGRFIPFTRSTASFMSGAHEVKLSKFLYFSFIGNSLWVSVFVFLGYALGQSYKFSQNIGAYLTIGAVLSILGFYLYYFVKLILKKVNSNGNKSAKPYKKVRIKGMNKIKRK